MDPGSAKFLLPQPDNKVLALPLEQFGARQFETAVSMPGYGAYVAMIQYSVRGESKLVMVPFDINFPEEWRFGDPADGEQTMQQWLSITGGQNLTFEQEIQRTLDQVAEQKSVRWFELLLVLLVISWPLEIAVRRWQMPWRRP